MLRKMNLTESLIRQRIPATLTLITLTLFLIVFFLPAVEAQRRRPVEEKATLPIEIGPISPVVACCGKKPPFKSIPNYSTSTYSSFTGQIAIATNYAGAANNPSLVVWDLKNQSSAPLGSQWTIPSTNFYTHPQWTRAYIGDVFGITLDGGGNIYAAATRVYGFNNVGSNLVTPGNGGNGDVYKINGNTGSVTRLVQTANVNTYTSGNKLPNKGVGLGQITYSCDHNTLFVTDFEDGLIYQVDPNSGNILSTWNHGQNLPTASPSRPAIPDSVTDGLTQAGRRVWAVKVLNGRAYYSVWSDDEGTQANPPNEIWSVGLNGAGGFTGSAKLELVLPPLNVNGPYSNPVADISFNNAGTSMLLAERSMNPITNVFAAHNSRLLECKLIGNTWTLEPLTKFRIGSYNTQTNADGGADYDEGPNGRVWATGDYLNPQLVYGLQGLPPNGGTYLNSIEIDLNNTPGTGDKRWMGDVEIPCFQCDGGPPAPVIVPPQAGCAKSGQYCVQQAPGVTYSWNITGGTPATATGSCVNITWGSTPPKAITVTATNAAGCTTITRLLLEECAPPVDPCCPPWNKDLLKDTMFYQPSGSISAPYTLHFQPSVALKNQIQAYLNYLHAINPSISQLIIDWELHNGNYPVVGSQIGVTASTTWSYPGTGNFVTTGDPNFFSQPPFPMQVGNWYFIRTFIHLPNGQSFFSEKCREVGMWVRIQVLAAKIRGGSQPAVLEISDGQNVIKRISIEPGQANPIMQRKN